VKKILISLLAIVLVAGCTIPGLNLGGTTTIGTSGKGLEITTFTAEPTPVYSNARVRVTMEVENQGGTTVSKSKALVYLTGSNVDLGSGDDRYWRSSDDEEYKTFDRDMRAADVVKGTSADTKRFTWSLTAPALPAGQTRTDTFYGRTYCDYTTGVNGNVWVYTEGEADAAKASGRSLNLASFTSTSGPVGLSVKVSPDPVIYYSDTTGGETFSLYITVSNLASGTIYERGKDYSSTPFSIADTQYNQVWVNVNPASGLNILNSPDCTGKQELPAGKSTTLVCDFTVSSPETFKSYPITITADYGYFTERSATVVVQGKSATTTPPSSTPTCTGSANICPSLTEASCTTCGCSSYDAVTGCEGIVPCSSLTQTRCSGCGCTWG
jgi:hypothetical protein